MWLPFSFSDDYNLLDYFIKFRQEHHQNMQDQVLLIRLFNENQEA